MAGRLERAGVWLTGCGWLAGWLAALPGWLVAWLAVAGLLLLAGTGWLAGWRLWVAGCRGLASDGIGWLAGWLAGSAWQAGWRWLWLSNVTSFYVVLAIGGTVFIAFCSV